MVIRVLVLAGDVLAVLLVDVMVNVLLREVDCWSGNADLLTDAAKRPRFFRTTTGGVSYRVCTKLLPINVRLRYGHERRARETYANLPRARARTHAEIIWIRVVQSEGMASRGVIYRRCAAA